MKRLRYRREDGSIAFFATKWTDQAAKDPFLEWAKGKAIARPGDLLKLWELIQGTAPQRCKGK